MGFRYLFLLLALLIPSSGLAQSGRPVTISEQRVALVIGNAAYPMQPLSTAVNDAVDMSAKLKSLGFDVTLASDASLKEMTRAITRFGERLKPGGVALFYYAGHGIQVRGRNFLVPVDADIRGEAAVRSESVDVDLLLEQVLSARVSIVILDACRNNPFERRFRSRGGAGLAQIDAPKGTLIAYATAPGKTADDGQGRNGLYTQALLKAIDQPGLPIETIFKMVRVEVARASDDNQIPWEASSLTGEFFFRPETTATATAPSGAPRENAATLTQIEDSAWEGIRDQKNPAVFEEYLRQFPQGRYAALARVKIVSLRQADESADWKLAEAAGGPADFEAYLRKYPDGRFAQLAKVRLQKIKVAEVKPLPRKEADAWAQVEAAAEVAAVKAFLARYPGGKFAPKARTMLAELERTKVRYPVGSAFRDCADCPEMVVIPEGRFLMGGMASDSETFANEVPRHEVLITRAFAMGRHEVTQLEWQRVMAANPSHFATCGEKCPVEMISREEAREFARRLSARTGARYRLPSEAEWEYACRGGSNSAYCGGDDPDAVAWHPGNARAPQPVLGRKANAFGLHDMTGNVAEWVDDCWAPDYADAPVDGRSRSLGRCDLGMLRGGSWLSDTRYLRPTQRLRAPLETPRGLNIGFRLARDLP